MSEGVHLITVMLLSLIRIMEKGFCHSIQLQKKEKHQLIFMIHYYLRKQFLALNMVMQQLGQVGLLYGKLSLVILQTEHRLLLINLLSALNISGKDFLD